MFSLLVLFAISPAVKATLYIYTSTSRESKGMKQQYLSSRVLSSTSLIAMADALLSSYTRFCTQKFMHTKYMQVDNHTQMFSSDPHVQCNGNVLSNYYIRISFFYRHISKDQLRIIRSKDEFRLENTVPFVKFSLINCIADKNKNKNKNFMEF